VLSDMTKAFPVNALPVPSVFIMPGASPPLQISMADTAPASRSDLVCPAPLSQRFHPDPVGDLVAFEAQGGGVTHAGEHLDVVQFGDDAFEADPVGDVAAVEIDDQQSASVSRADNMSSSARPVKVLSRGRDRPITA
jgi:hypothetical protein